MYEHEPRKNLMQMLFCMPADRFTETGKCVVCGGEWQYSGHSEADLRQGIADMGHMCAYCESADDEERERMRQFAREEKSSNRGGLFHFLFGI